MKRALKIFLKPAINKKSKFSAKILFNDGSKKTVNFGQFGASDYTQHKDEDRKIRYLSRHAPRENWTDITKAGTFSRFILWNKPTLVASIRDFSRRFNVEINY